MVAIIESSEAPGFYTSACHSGERNCIFLYLHAFEVKGVDLAHGPSRFIARNVSLLSIIEMRGFEVDTNGFGTEVSVGDHGGGGSF